jgi:hypothetical protein
MVALARSCPFPSGNFDIEGEVTKQWLIFDTRLVNLLFGDPPSTLLASTGAMPCFETNSDKDFFIGSVDLACCFYHLYLDNELGELFRWRSAPMTAAAASSSPTLTPARPPFYVDNYATSGHDATQVGAALRDINDTLRVAGPVVRDVPGASCDCTFAGLEPRERGYLVAVSKKRIWTLRGALEDVIDRNYVSRTALRVLLGHFTWCALSRREALSNVHACYAFVEKVGPSKVRLGAGARRELSETIAISPLLRTNLSAAWHTTGVSVDASVSGIGICRRTIDPLEIGRLGCASERWRFSGRGRQQNTGKRHEAAGGARPRAYRVAGRRDRARSRVSRSPRRAAPGS